MCTRLGVDYTDCKHTKSEESDCSRKPACKLKFNFRPLKGACDWCKAEAKKAPEPNMPKKVKKRSCK